MSLVNLRIVTASAACLATLIAGPACAQAYKTSMQVSPQGGGKCIDVPNRQFNAGQELQMADCKIILSQTFSYDPVLKTIAIGGHCVDANGGKPGELVTLQLCEGGAGQVWKAQKQGKFIKFVGVAGLCLDVRYGSKENGALVQSWNCGKAAPNQLWFLQPR
jgi:streptogrisin C